MNKFTSLLPLVLALAACGSSEPPAPASSAPAAKAELDQPATPTPPQSAQQTLAYTLDSAIAGDWRSEANKARDPYRHPKETLEFFGVKPTGTLIEITPGSGWYAQILAPLMHASGTYVAAVAKPRKPEGEAAQDKSSLQTMFESDPKLYGAAQTVVFDGAAPVFGPANSADVVLTFRNVHNWAMGGNAPAMFKGFFEVLKPGGTLGVVDHRATAGESFDKVKDSGYLPTDYVIKLATDAGFKLVAQSEINANPKDDHHHEQGVWTLPPTFALGEKDHQKYADIGESDRMTLKFEKPVGDQVFKTKD